MAHNRFIRWSRIPRVCRVAVSRLPHVLPGCACVLWYCHVYSQPINSWGLTFKASARSIIVLNDVAHSFCLLFSSFSIVEALTPLIFDSSARLKLCLARSARKFCDRVSPSHTLFSPYFLQRTIYLTFLSWKVATYNMCSSASVQLLLVVRIQFSKYNVQFLHKHILE